MIYFDEYGDRENPTILMLHGGMLTDGFAGQYCLKEKYHLVIPHLMGTGKEVDKLYNSKMQIEAILELIKHLNKDKIVVMGHSLGSELAVTLVTKYPEFFKKAIFLSPCLFTSEESNKHYTDIGRRMHSLSKWAWLIRLQCKYLKFTKEQTSFMVEYCSKITKDHISALYSNRITLDELTGYANVKVPMIAVCGSKELEEVKHSLSELNRRNDFCKTIVVKGGSHLFLILKSNEVNQIVQNFLT